VTDNENLVVGQGQAAQPIAEATEAAQTGAVTAPEPASKAIPASESPKRDLRPTAIEALKPGMRFKGRVRNVVDFGAFIDIGVGRDGLAHISVLKKAGIEKSIQVGDQIDVIVRRVELDENRISLTLPSSEPERSDKTSLRDLSVGSVVTGHVVRLADFGAFVDVGAQVDGLLHVSQLPWGYVNNPSEVLKVGDEVQVRVQEVDARKRRISLSMRELEAGKAQEAAPEEPADPGERLPTAFEAAFERARAQRRQRRAHV
jgi:small subunit ribosomal protein S1